jgi:phosphoribosylformylglycinamidine cyclo-ligase
MKRQPEAANQPPAQKMTYASAGVDIAAGAEVVERIRAAVTSTYGGHTIVGALGGFAGLLELPTLKNPLLVSATDGVGTKVLIAEALGRYDTVGIDLVAMSVNDLLVTGARPLFFLDYLAVGKLEPEKAAALVEGVAAGCRQAGCALLGGETAEMPDLYQGGHFDLAGFAVGVVEKEKLIDGSRVSAGDAVIGLPSTGIHSNGFSLVRRILDHNGVAYTDPLARIGIQTEANPSLTGAAGSDSGTGPQATVGEKLLEPTMIYASAVEAALGACDIRAMAHITGGGLPENLPRVIPAGMRARIDRTKWRIPALFDSLQRLGNVDSDEMFRTFNMGIGYVVIVAAADEASALKVMPGSAKIGEIVAGEGGVEFITQ